jgi:hypothetical protein
VRTLITYFLLNDESQRLISQGKAAYSFSHQREGCAVEVLDAPHEALAYSEHDVRESYRRHRLVIDEPIRYGSWVHREGYLPQARSGDFQDIVIAHKPR